LTEPFDRLKALFRRRFREIALIEVVAFFEARDSDDTLHAHKASMPGMTRAVRRMLVKGWNGDATSTA
jgi:hypothetical protein